MNLPQPLPQIIKYLIFIALCIFVFDNYTNINMRTVIASLGILSLGIALAAREIFANLLGGICILIDKPFRVNDYITIAGNTGRVEAIYLRSTVIRTEKLKIVIVPNKFISDNTIEKTGNEKF